MKDKNSHIPTDEIMADIAETQKEIDDYSDEKKVLMRNPQENKLRIYLLEGKISQREKFVEKLKLIIIQR